MKKLPVLIGIFILFSPAVYALDGLEFLSGYFTGDIKDRKDIQAVPLLVAFNFDAKPFFADKLGWEIQGRLDWAVEPIISTIVSPRQNAEIGTNFLAKYSFPLTERFQPYVKLGAGLLYMTIWTKEQGTKFNFTPQAGAGFHFFMDKNTALTLEYRTRHLSNNHMGGNNNGVDVDMYLGGLSFYWD